MSGQDFATCPPSLPYPQALARYTPEPPVATAGGSPVAGKCHWSRVLWKWQHLMSDMTERNHMSPRVPTNGHSSIGIHHITT
jgi:hypothetical protein